MSMKTIPIPSRTEEQEPYQVKIPIIDPALQHQDMLMLEAAHEIKNSKDALAEGNDALEKAKDARDRCKTFIDTLVEVEADPVMIAEKKIGYAEAVDLVAEITSKRDKLLEAMKENIDKVKEHFGDIPDVSFGELELTYLLAAKDICGEPWVVMACCDLGPKDWLDIRLEDYAKICKEILRRNIRFFRLRHPEKVARK